MTALELRQLCAITELLSMRLIDLDTAHQMLDESMKRASIATNPQPTRVNQPHSKTK